MKHTSKGFYGLLIIGVLSLAILAGCGTTIPTTNNDDDTTNNDDNTTTAPAAPTSVTATAGDGQVTISWSAVSDATSYNVYWSATTGVTKTSGTKITGATSPYIHASLTNDTTYYYVVTAVNSSGESVESAQASATPSLFSGTYTGSWSKTCPTCGVTDTSGTFTTTVANGVFTNTIITNTSGGDNSAPRLDSGTVSSSGAITGTGATPSQCSSSVTTFTGQITTTSSGGADMTMTYSRPASDTCAAESGTITATRTTTTTAPSAPTGVTATAGDGQVTISWSAVSDATSYNVFWSTTTGVTKTNGTKITGATSPYIHTALTNGTAYYYVVTAVNSYGESGESTEVSATPTTANTWATKASMPTARASMGVGVVTGVLYAAGGFTGTSSTNTVGTVEAYDAAANTWSTKASMPTARVVGFAEAINGLFYVVGGCTTNCTFSSLLATVEAYDPATNTWTTKAPMPTARHAGGVGVVNGILYAVGGVSYDNNGNGTALATVEAYDPVTNTWTTKAPMPTARYVLATGVVNGILYAVGGANVSNSVFYATVEAYNPVTNTWTTKASMPTPRGYLAAGVVNGVLYAVGGYTGNGNFPATVEAYDPATNTWTTKADMPTVRNNLSVGVITGVLYAVGGGNSSGALATVEAYTP